MTHFDPEASIPLDGAVPTMLLGVFHFKDQSLDRHKPQHGFDSLSERRQQEIANLFESLARFAPTKIAIEVSQSQQPEIDRDYQAYCRNEFELSANEIHQIGFRLARQLGHERVHCVNAWDRYYDPPIDLETYPWSRESNELDALFESRSPEAYAKAHGQENVLSQWWPHYQVWSQAGDELTDRQTLQETLLRINSERELLRSHGAYLVDAFKVGRGHEYIGPDWVTHWYNRNLRIFANLQRITESPNNRILLIIGAGHVPILRHCVQASPEYRLVEVSDYVTV